MIALLQVAALQGGMEEVARLKEQAKEAAEWVRREVGALEVQNSQLKAAMQGKDEEMQACKVALLDAQSSSARVR
jgi:hypothetical protein